MINRNINLLIVFILICLSFSTIHAQKNKFRVIAFYKNKTEQAHESFVHEANQWFAKMAAKNKFTYDSTNNWDNLNDKFLSGYQLVLFLDSRPDSLNQRMAFEKYMKNGGAWMGFHFAAFALTPSDFPQDWDWYHNEFLGSGQYKSNTWRPTSAILRNEDQKHPVSKNLPQTFKASPNEWYCWEKDLRQNPDIKILFSVDSTSFPLGTGPKPYEIWHSGYYPVIWTNRNYKMLYFNMGHNDIDYEHNSNKELSFTFKNEIQNQLIMNGLFWLTKGQKQSSKLKKQTGN